MAVLTSGVAAQYSTSEKLAARARLLNQPFRKHARTGVPHVLFKSAMTLDGKVATETGDSKWISGPTSRELVHRWRAEADAVAVGVGTALADDPQLTARVVSPTRTAARVAGSPMSLAPPWPSSRALSNDARARSGWPASSWASPSRHVRIRSFGLLRASASYCCSASAQRPDENAAAALAAGAPATTAVRYGRSTARVMKSSVVAIAERTVAELSRMSNA